MKCRYNIYVSYELQPIDLSSFKLYVYNKKYIYV